MNIFILCVHVMTISCLTLIALRCGLLFITAWLSLLAILMNLFVLKQITLLSLNVTSSDALAVGYLLGLNLIQEFFGKKEARKCIGLSFFISFCFVVLSQIHLLYQPNQYDLTQSHFFALFSFIPRIFFASLFSFFVVQFVDILFFDFLKKKWSGKYLSRRTALALILSQTLDTFLFSYLGLYGLVPSITSVIFLSLAIKAIVILLSTPFVFFSKKVISHVKV